MEKVSDRKLKVILYSVLLFISGIPAMMLSLPVVLDETGTIANVAYLFKYDWSYFVQYTGGYYYKPGQALTYIPLFAFIKDPVILYKAMMFVNAALISLIVVIVYDICRRDLKIESKAKAAMMAVIANIIPSILLYSEYARGDIILIVAPWVVLWFLLRAFAANTEKKKILFSLGVSFFSVYSYLSHSRGIVIVIATLLTVVLMKLFVKVRAVNFKFYFGSTVLFLIADRAITQAFKLAIWGEDGAKHATMESLSLGEIKKIFTGPGIKSMAKLVIGWAYSIFTGTGGLICIGIVAIIIIYVAIFNKKMKVSTQEKLIALFGGLNFAGAYAMGALFFFKYVHAFYIGKSLNRGDRLIYDRYLPGTLGILCLIALYFLVYRGDLFKIKAKIASFLMFGGVLGIFSIGVAPRLNGALLSVRNFISLNMFAKIPFGKNSGIFDNISHWLMWGGILSLAILLIILCIHRVKKGTVMCILIAALFMTSFSINYYKVRYGIDVYTKDRLVWATDYLKDFRDIIGEFPYVMIDNTAGSERPYRMALKEFDMLTYESEQTQFVKDMFIVGKKGTYNLKYYDDDYYLLGNVDYENVKGDVIYIKGEALNKKVQERGISTTKVEIKK